MARILVVDDSPTILRVVSSILARHGYEPTIARDGLLGIELLKKGQKFDLVLLDFVMPRMNGYQFCRELRSSPAHRALPVVLMSAKSDKIRGQFVQQTGAVDAITKPFDARALVAVIEGALTKTSEGRARPVPEGNAMPEEDTLHESVHPSLTPKQNQQRAALEFANQVGNALIPAILSLSDQERRDESVLLAVIGKTMSGDIVSTLASTLRDLEPGVEGSKEVMNGDIAAIALAEVLQILQMQRQTGVLRVNNTRTVTTISIRLGLIDLVQSRGAAEEFRLGRYFVERGLVSRDELEGMVKSNGARHKLLGNALVDMGRVSRDDLVEALTRQSSELIYDVLRWPFGRFTFSKEAFRPEAESAKLGIGISGIVLEGFRRVDEWRLMEGHIHFDNVVVVNEAALDGVDKEMLTRTEKLVLDAVDGVRTVNDVIKESAVGSFDGIKVIYQFLQSRVIRTRT